MSYHPAAADALVAAFLLFISFTVAGGAAVLGA